MSNIWEFTTTGGIEIQFYETEDKYLRVKCVVVDAVLDKDYRENPFKIHKPPFGEVKEQGDKIKIGAFFVKPEDEGYILYDKDETPIYRSELKIVMDPSGKFVALETPYDRVGMVQELWETRTYFDKYFFTVAEQSVISDSSVCRSR